MTTQHIVVTGASRGLGLEMVRQLSAAGHEVLALARNPRASHQLQELVGDRVTASACDVTDDASVAAAATACPWSTVDLLINNAGISGQRSDLVGLDLEDLTQTFAVNAVAPLRVTRAFLPRLRAATAPRVLHVTSKMGSIADNSSGGVYGYRMSKTALNMAVKCLHLELAPAVTTWVMHPGWVQTDMGGSGAPLTIPDAVARMLATAARITPAQSGTFVDLDGVVIPW